jgi:hypothetical protein
MKVAKKPGQGEEREGNRQNHRAGMPVDLAEPVVTAACFLVAGGRWVRPSPGIPCALFHFGGGLSA